MSPEQINKLRGLAFSNPTECLRLFISIFQNIQCDIEYLSFLIEELQQQNQKEKKMDKEVVNIEVKAKECDVHPYFMMDILSGDFIGIFSVKNDETAVRTFCMNMDNFPESLVHDTVLVKYDDKSIVFEGKDYIETWKQNHANQIPQLKGVPNAR